MNALSKNRLKGNENISKRVFTREGVIIRKDWWRYFKVSKFIN